MRIKSPIWSLFALTVISGTLFAQEPPDDWKKPAEHIKAGNYQQALDETQTLLAKRPDDALLHRMKGLSLLQLGRLDEAAAVFRGLLQQDPSSIAVRFYLAQVLAYQGNITLAIDLLNAIRKEAPDSRYAEQAARVLPKLENLAVTARAVSQDKRWNLSLRTGFEYDDNVLGRSKHERIPGDDIDSFRSISSAYVEIRPIDQKLDGRPFTLGTGYSIYQNFHERTETFQHYDLTSQSGRVFVSHGNRIGAMPYKAQVTADFTSTNLANDFYGDETGLKAGLDLQWIRWAMVSPYYSIRWKAFKNDTSQPGFFSRDGKEESLGVNQRFYAFDNAVVFGTSAAYHWSGTEGDQFDSDSYDLGGTVSLSLPWQFGVMAGVGYQSDDFFEYTPEPKRQDDAKSVFLSVTHPLWRPDLTLEFNYAYTTTSSSQDFSESRRSVYGMAVSYYV